MSQPSQKPPAPELVLLIDKPLEWTSFDVVKKIRNAMKIKKIGHAGTLDPLATGLLILCTGKKTKSIEGYQAQVKEYTGSITIGATTPSFDLETEVTPSGSIDNIDRNDLENTATTFLGTQEQIPPMYSAVKVNGVRAYKHARNGEVVPLKSRTIEISTFEITNFEGGVFNFRIVCSKGTYIRSIARDFGEQLGCGAYLSSLRRTKIGDFDVKNAITIEKAIELHGVKKLES